VPLMARLAMFARVISLKRDANRGRC
jgi:hypothetical protein